MFKHLLIFLQFQIIFVVSKSHVRIRGTFNCDLPKFCRSVSLKESDLLFDDHIVTWDEKCVSNSNIDNFIDEIAGVAGDFSPSFEFYLKVNHNCTTDGKYEELFYEFEDVPVDDIVHLNFNLDLTINSTAAQDSDEILENNSTISLNETLKCDQPNFCRTIYLMEGTKDNAKYVHKYSDFCAHNMEQNKDVRYLEDVSVSNESQQFFLLILHNCNARKEWKTAYSNFKKSECRFEIDIDLNEKDSQQVFKPPQ